MRARTLTLVGAIVLFFAATIVWLSSDPRVSKDFVDRYSSLNTAGDGLSLARRYLSAERKTSLLTRSIDEEELPRDAVVLRIGPSLSPMFSAADLQEERTAKPRNRDVEPFLTNAEESWVSRGGRLVLAIDGDYGPLRTIAGDVDSPAKVFPLWRGVTKLSPAVRRVFERSPHLGHSIFTAGTHAFIARRNVGEGEVIFIAQPELFANDSLGKDDHLPLLLQLTSGRSVYFDETVHGIRTDAGLVELMKRWGLGPALILLLVAVGLNFWRRGRRVGPAEGEFIERRSEAVDMVESMAQLYDRSLTRLEAIDAYQEMLSRTVASRLFLRGAHLEKKVGQLLGSKLPVRQGKALSKEEFQRQLILISEAFRRLEHEKHR